MNITMTDRGFIVAKNEIDKQQVQMIPISDAFLEISQTTSAQLSEAIYPMAHDHIQIGLDDGVKANYNKFPHALRKVTGLSEW